MSTAFVTQGIWPELTKAVRASERPCAVAVAYFGKGASRLLPLSKGSRLVVDASDGAVKSGQTHPADLLALVEKGVRVFSIPNLHAKVFVTGRTAYIGSANVSHRSATQLVEAVVRTTEPDAVRDARQFVQDHCLHELTPSFLDRLGKLYRPPHVPGGKRGKRKSTAEAMHPSLPRLHLAQLKLQDWSEHDQALHDEALIVAKKRQEHPRSFELDSFRTTGRCRYQARDVIIQVTDEGRDGVLVTPPGNVLLVRTRRNRKGQVSFIYLEHPARRRRPIKALAKGLGRGAQKRLSRDGLIRDAGFARALLNAWTK